MSGNTKATHSTFKSALGTPGFTPFHPSNASILLEKTKAGVRRSTPDSEALASSDEESDLHRPLPSATTAKPGRRSSWMTDIPSGTQVPQRKPSLSAGTTYSPANSNPTTPSADQSTWGSATSPAIGGGVSWNSGAGPSFPWSTGIWNTEARGKEPPPRLTEVLASPTTSMAPHPEEAFHPRLSVTGEGAIPFAIPLHPTPKTYRSQSYSVGQLDKEIPNADVDSAYKTHVPAAQSRGFSGNKYSGLQHRPSRPSMLGDYPSELGQLREDDDNSTNGSDDHQPWNRLANSFSGDPLTTDNLALRKVASNPQEVSRFRERAVSSSAGSNFGLGGNHRIPGAYRLQSSVPEESDLAVDDFVDNVSEVHGYGDYRGTSAARRYSEAQANYGSQYHVPSVENRALETVKNAHWQTSPLFPGIIEAPQSRRHSFADIPARHGSIASADTVVSPGTAFTPNTIISREDPYAGYGNSNQMASPVMDPREYQAFLDSRQQAELELEREHLHLRQLAESYFAIPQARRMMDIPSPPPGPHMKQGFHSYGRHAPNQSNQLLYIVTFKCCRADVFYTQEETGLEVHPGDLVIVEADRGTDLGTVAHANVSWAKARELKDHYAEEHYKWLMLFSNQSRSGAPNAVNPNGLNHGHPGSAIGGMGPPGQHGSQEAQSAEFKPKLIKRLAQNHEIQCLREKEGNEAKAKRVCQQKVVEHRLNMEILDAECQMDWKKLTFYYFADTYINFNSLVTDLFKVYKTRIWMSAINPASFVTPTAGLQPPSVMGPGALGFGSDSAMTRRQQPDRDGVPRAMYMDPYQQFAQPPRQAGLGLSAFAPAVSPQPDPFASYSPAPLGYQYPTMDPNMGNYITTGSNGYSAMRRQPGPDEFTAGMQGLSLS